MSDPNDVPLEQKIRTIKLAQRMIEDMLAQQIGADAAENMRKYREVILDPWERAIAQRAAPRRPAPKAETVAVTRSPEEEAELEAALAEARAYRGTGTARRRG